MCVEVQRPCVLHGTIPMLTRVASLQRLACYCVLPCVSHFHAHADAHTHTQGKHKGNKHSFCTSMCPTWVAMEPFTVSVCVNMCVCVCVCADVGESVGVHVFTCECVCALAQVCDTRKGSMTQRKSHTRTCVCVCAGMTSFFTFLCACLHLQIHSGLPRSGW
jgi:hypothetical protein